MSKRELLLFVLVAGTVAALAVVVTVVVARW